MEKTLRIGLVGTGFAGDFHERCLKRVHGVEVEIAGVTSLRKTSRDAFGAARNIPVFDSVEAMLDRIDLLDVCSPPCIHEENIIAAARAGKHIICEKPLTGCFGPADASDFYGDKADKLTAWRMDDSICNWMSRTGLMESAPMLSRSFALQGLP